MRQRRCATLPSSSDELVGREPRLLPLPPIATQTSPHPTDGSGVEASHRELVEIEQAVERASDRGRRSAPAALQVADVHLADITRIGGLRWLVKRKEDLTAPSVRCPRPPELDKFDAGSQPRLTLVSGWVLRLLAR